MAGASLFTLLDDIATILDDVSVMAKVAVKKTAGVVGDDLALNANQVQGIAAARELPVVWAVARGSLVNKLILVPVALVLSVFAPLLIKPLLMLGGTYLCFEGVEKLLHARDKPSPHLTEPPVVRDEREQIRGAVRTDFVLSAEIIVIALGTISPDADVLRRLAVLAAIGLGMTVGVYGLVAVIVKIDDVGLALAASRRGDWLGALCRALGRALLVGAPWLMKFLSVAGTVAMFLVGGEILLHGFPSLHPPEGLAGAVVGIVAGLVAGFVAVGAVTVVKKVAALVRRPA